jgi:DNA-binding response OmpR family regulator
MELVARLRTRLRINSEAPKRVVRWADVELDLDSRMVTVAGADAGFTRNEFDVLAHLVERQGRAISRAQLAEHALTPFEQRDARTVDSHIARIRKKLGAEGGGRVVTVWGIGYRFEADKGDK